MPDTSSVQVNPWVHTKLLKSERKDVICIYDEAYPAHSLVNRWSHDWCFRVDGVNSLFPSHSDVAFDQSQHARLQRVALHHILVIFFLFRDLNVGEAHRNTSSDWNLRLLRRAITVCQFRTFVIDS